jgi:hypothetical protein
MAHDHALAAHWRLRADQQGLALDRCHEMGTKWASRDLRDVAACWMRFDLGLDPAVVAHKLGHADPNFTIRRYIGVRLNRETAAMAVTDGW